jgi:hypothetical protein
VTEIEDIKAQQRYGEDNKMDRNLNKLTHIARFPTLKVIKAPGAPPE